MTRLLLKSADGENTTFVLPNDPLALGERIPGGVPVWKLNLANIQVLAYLPEGGPPSPFLSSHAKDILMFNLSSRPGGRAPIHVNADFDEVVHYVRGQSGRVVLFSSSDPGETAAVADRAIVFVDGMLAHELRGDELTEHQLVTAMNTSAKPTLRPAA